SGRVEAARDDELLVQAGELELDAAGGVRGRERGRDHVVERPGLSRRERERGRRSARRARSAGRGEEAAVGRRDVQAGAVRRVEGADVGEERSPDDDGRDGGKRDLLGEGRTGRRGEKKMKQVSPHGSTSGERLLPSGL